MKVSPPLPKHAFVIPIPWRSAAPELWCRVAKCFAGFLDCLKLLLKALQDLLFMAAELASACCYGFQVVDLSLYLLRIPLGEALVALGCNICFA